MYLIRVCSDALGIYDVSQKSDLCHSKLAFVIQNETGFPEFLEHSVQPVVVFCTIPSCDEDIISMTQDSHQCRPSAGKSSFGSVQVQMKYQRAATCSRPLE